MLSRFRAQEKITLASSRTRKDNSHFLLRMRISIVKLVGFNFLGLELLLLSLGLGKGFGLGLGLGLVTLGLVLGFGVRVGLTGL